MRKLLYGSGVLALLCFIQISYAPLMVNAATPTIANVSGTVQTGQILTVTGSNLINENKANWVSFFSTNANAYGFEGASPTADFYCDLGPCFGTYDSSVKLMGNKSIKFHSEGSASSCDGPGVCGNYNAFNSGVSNGSWTRFYSRWNLVNGSWPDTHVKMFYDLSNYYVQPSQTSNGALPSQILIKLGNATYYPNIPSGQLQNNRWYLFEVYLSTSNIQVWLDGVQIYSGAPADSDSSNLLLFGLINVGSAKAFSLDNWMDNLATSTSRIYASSTIEISNSATYGSGTKVYQEPVYLSDGSVQIKANLSGLGSGPYYLWVTNNSQARSTAYSLSGGGTASAAPLPPTIIYVQ
jgi:hypothetical protein